MKSRAMSAIGIFAAAIITITLSGCGSGPKIGAQPVTTLELRRDMTDLAEAAAAHNTAGANSALAALKNAATSAHATHVIDDATFARILAAAAQVRSDLTASLSATPSSSATAAATRSPQPPKQKPTPTVSPVQPAKGKTHGKGHGPGHGGEGDD